MKTFGSAIALCATLALPAAADPSFVLFKAPNSQLTEPVAINDAGAVTGSSFEHSNPDCQGTCGFIRAADGSFTIFGLNDGRGTMPRAINNLGAVTGWHGGLKHRDGFVRAPNGLIATFTVPDGSDVLPTDINDDGTVIGYFRTSRHRDRGFVRAPDGTIRTIKGKGCQGTRPLAINNEGIATGECVTRGDHSRGFLRAPDGAITLFDVSGATYTVPVAIDDNGSAVGTYVAASSLHCFVRRADGSFELFDLPEGHNLSGIASIRETEDDTIVAGTNSDDGLHFYGFVHHQDGTLESFQVADGVNTIVMDANASGAIAGVYNDGSKPHGFVRLP